MHNMFNEAWFNQNIHAWFIDARVSLLETIRRQSDKAKTHI